jgi:targeting protein for Xklp2
MQIKEKEKNYKRLREENEFAQKVQISPLLLECSAPNVARILFTPAPADRPTQSLCLKIEEEKALKQLRRTMVPHARPLPKFDRPFRPQK